MPTYAVSRYRLATCREDGCASPAWEDGLCRVHLKEHRQVTRQRKSPRADYSYPIGPKPACTIPGCATVTRSRGLCGKHYVTHRREVTRPPVAPKDAACTFQDCQYEHTVWGFLCKGHYRQLFAGLPLRPLVASASGWRSLAA